MLDIDLPTTPSAAEAKYTDWLRKLLDGVENSNSSALEVARVAYLVAHPSEDPTFMAQVRERIVEGLMDVHDYDTPWNTYARAAAERLFPSTAVDRRGG